MLSQRENEIICIMKEKNFVTSGDVVKQLSTDSSVSLATVKRSLGKLVSENLLIVMGQGRSTKYTLSPVYSIVMPVDMDIYYAKDIDERVIKTTFNWEFIRDIVGELAIFSDQELSKLEELQNRYINNITQQVCISKRMGATCDRSQLEILTNRRQHLFTARNRAFVKRKRNGFRKNKR